MGNRPAYSTTAFSTDHRAHPVLGSACTPRATRPGGRQTGGVAEDGLPARLELRGGCPASLSLYLPCRTVAAFQARCGAGHVPTALVL
jgi:hypothetical protein